MTEPNGSLLFDEAIDNAKKFGFDDYSTLLASIIRDRKLRTPFTIAVHGEWGSGKTSLMMTVEKKLGVQDNELVRVKPIWFNAWEFEKIQTPLWIVFINRIIMDLQDMIGTPQLKSKIKAIGKGVILLSIDAFLSRTVGFSLEYVDAIKERVWENIKQIDCLREELSKYIEIALQTDPEKRKRLVIFIDDLDRCLPEQCIEIFEAIKLFLNCKNCVFVVGVDKEQIQRVFEWKFGKNGNSDSLCYFEKFVQLEFALPRKSPEEVKEFLVEQASEALQENPKTIELISRFIEPNPRKIKRWINSVLFLERLFRIKQERLKLPVNEIDLSLASIWMFLKSFFPDFAELIELDPSVLNAAINVTNGKGSDEEKEKIGDFRIDKKLGEFLSVLKPYYNERKLEDMVYLSKLTPVSNVSIVPTDILERIAELKPQEIVSQLTLLDKDGTLSLVDRLIDNLSDINEWKDYDRSTNLFDVISTIFDAVEATEDKIAILNKIIDFSLSSQFAYRYFSSRLTSYLQSPELKQYFGKPELLDKLIAVFAESSSFENAKKNSATLQLFVGKFSSKQIDNIITCTAKNGQILSSFGAQENLKKIFTKQKATLTSDQKTRIGEMWKVEV